MKAVVVPANVLVALYALAHELGQSEEWPSWIYEAIDAAYPYYDAAWSAMPREDAP